MNDTHIPNLDLQAHNDNRDRTLAQELYYRGIEDEYVHSSRDYIIIKELSYCEGFGVR